MLEWIQASWMKGFRVLLHFACNQLLHLDSVFSCAAIDIGTHARSSYDVHTIDGYRDEIWSGERQLQIENDFDDEIFDIDNDYDKFYDDMIYLL